MENVAKRTSGGRVILTAHVIRPQDLRKPAKIDPVVNNNQDPQTVTDKQLKRLICSVGSVKYCPRCESYEKCRYGQEYIRRETARTDRRDGKAAAR